MPCAFFGRNSNVRKNRQKYIPPFTDYSLSIKGGILFDRIFNHKVMWSI